MTRIDRGPASPEAVHRWAGPDTHGPQGRLRHRTASAARWSFLGFAGQQGLRALTAIALARLIGPENYGVVAQALILMAFMSVLFSQGVGVTLIQALELDDRMIGTGVCITAGTSAVLAALTFLFSGPLSVFFHTPQLQAVLQVLAIAVLLEGFAVVPQNLLLRGLRMRSVALREVAAAFIGGGLAIAAALAGADYWAIVVQILATDVITLVVLVAMVGRIPLRPSMETFHKIRGFSLRVFLIGALSFAVRNADNAIVGRVLGPVQLAFYALSYRTMMVVVQGLSYTANRTTLPVFSQLQNQTVRLRSAYFEVSEMLAVVGFPFMALCAAGAPTGVPLIMGTAWEPAVPVIQILAVTGAQQSVTSACAPAFMATGRADLVLRFQIFNATASVSAFIIGVQWGIVGVAVAYVIVSTLAWPVAIVMLGHVLNFRLRDFVRVMVPSASATAVLIGIFFAVEQSVKATTDNAWLGLVVAVVAGLVGFAGTYFLMWRSDAERVLAGARALIFGRQPQAAPLGAQPDELSA